MNKYTVAAIVIIVACFGGLVAWSTLRNEGKATDYSKYNSQSIIEDTDDNGNIADHVRGKTDSKVIVLEYADVQCPGCATMMPRMSILHKQYGDRVAFVFRNFPINGHQNARAASAACESAGFQGYFWEMLETLYSNRADWVDATGNKRTDIFANLFKEVAPDGDVEKFRTDLSNASIEKKINFDYGIGRNVDKVDGTPSVFVNGEKMNMDEGTFDDVIKRVEDKINSELEKNGERTGANEIEEE